VHVAGFGINAQIPGHEAPGGAVIDQLSDNAPAHVVGSLSIMALTLPEADV